MAMFEIGLTIAAIAILVAFLVSIRLSGPAVMVGAGLGAVVFAIGFFGPMIFLRESNIGPIIGVLLGPVAFYVGGLGGFAWYAIRAFRSSPRERNAYFIVLAVFALSPLFLYAGPLRWWQESDVADTVATMPKDAPLGEIRIWTVDSSHWVNRYGASSVPKMFGEAVIAAGGTASVEAISKEAFPRALADAVARNQLPDIIASLNYRLIGNEFDRHQLWSRMVKVHSVIAPLASEGGLKSGLEWLGVPYLDRQSDKFELMRKVMLQIPEGCSHNWEGVNGVDAQELAPLVKKMMAAYVARDIETLTKHRDPDALSFPDDSLNGIDAHVHGVVVCSLTGNDRLAFAKTVTVFERPDALGHQIWLLAVRRNGGSWRLLDVTSDSEPSRRISFERSATAKALSGESGTITPDAPMLLSPENNAHPQPTNGAKYGMFRWRPSDDANIAMEMLETACQDERGRTFNRLAMQLKPPSHEKYIAGEHPADASQNSRHWRCKWRVWRVARSGEIVFSETRYIPAME